MTNPTVPDAADPRRHRLRAARPGANAARAADHPRGQRATRPSSRATTSSSSPPTRTSTRTGSQATITGGAHDGTDVHGHPERRRNRADRRGDTSLAGDTRGASVWPATPASIRKPADATHTVAVYRAWRVRLPGQDRQHQGQGLRGCDRLQPHRRGRLRDAGQHARRHRHPGDLRVAHRTASASSARVARRATRATSTAAATGTPTPPAGPAAAGGHLGRLRRLGLHAHVPTPPTTAPRS